VDELRGRVGDGQEVLIRSNRDLKAASLEIFDRTFAITGVLRLLAFIVAFIGVLSALMALQLERGRELGVLRALGVTPRQVGKLVTVQTGLMGIVAGILAVPAGLLLAVVMIFVVNKRSFGWTLELELAWPILTQAVGLAVVGAILAGLYPSWRMAKTSPALALREE
jgi:putative ABC transport system permease protein